MRRTAVCLALFALAPIGARADQVLVNWDFSRDTQGWVAAHALSPLKVEGGTLKTRATSGDPYMVSPPGAPMAIEGNDFQYIEIRMKCTLKGGADGGAEFFWANSTEGKDGGFAAGRERSFTVKGDGKLHTCRLFPMWQGPVRWLRFDPPEQSAIEVASVRIMQAPTTRHEPTSPRWDFASEAGGGFVPTSGCTYQAGPNGLTVAMDDANAILTSGPLNLIARDYACATLHLTALAPLQMTLNWTEGAEASFPGSCVVPFDVPSGEQWITLPLSETPSWTSTVRRIALGFAGAEGASVTLHSLGFSKLPEGPARLTVLSLAGEKSLYQAGETVHLTARIRNGGGAQARGVRAELQAGSGLAWGGGPARSVDIGPGETAEFEWTLAAARTGVEPVTVRLTGDNLFRPERASTRLLVSARTPTMAASGTAPYARSVGHAAAIGNGLVRLTFAQIGAGLSCARLDLMDRGTPRTMGALPYLARLAVGAETEPVAIPMNVVGARSDRASAALTLRGARAGVTADVVYRVKPGQPWIDASYRLTCARPVAVRSFQGPWLWAGEGSFADDQDHALFPGVEWLVKGERSSTSLDIAPPMHTRFAPNPNWITVPSMAVEQGGALVGLMWDPLQKWDGARTRPSAAFASPNFLEERRNHLLGLFLPAIPDYVPTNRLLAVKPYRLAPGKALTLNATLFAAAGVDVTEAPFLWYRRFCADAPPALPSKARSYDATLAMGMQSFEKVLWKPAARAWEPVVGWAPGRDPNVAAMYDTMAALQTGPDATAWQARALEVGANSGDITFALRGHGSVEAAVGVALDAGRNAAFAQPAGARYTFQPEGQRKTLGPVGATAVGLASGPVEALMNTALRTGDARSLEAGLKGLAFMDQFDVPRAAQVWECPLHSPDILASGQACRAYLVGYRLTGKQEYLRKAIFWARTGLPFVYSWQAPDMPDLMKYSTIPIFGATFYTGSWFGVPVQWNGLDYGYACLELAKYDKSFPWRAIGEGITVSGMNQQSTRAIDYGTYTDNWNLVTNVECVGCMLSPAGIMANVFRLQGVDYNSGVDGVRTPTGWIGVNGPGSVSGVTIAQGRLRARVGGFAARTGTVVILPVTRPTSVTVDGVALNESKRSGGRETEGWRYVPAMGLVVVTLPFRAQPRTLELSGIERREPTDATTDWRFGAEGDALGWTAASDLSEPAVQNGALTMTITGGDPYLVGPSIDMPTGKVRGVSVRARVTRPGGELFWSTSFGSLAPARSRPFDLPADGRFHEAVIDLTGHPEWRGGLRQLRVDFNGATGDRVEVEWIRLVPR